MDANGNLYGTTFNGGANYADGTAFELTPSDGTWTETVLHSFGPPFGSDGSEPIGMTAVPGGMFYGTTVSGGGSAKAGAIDPQ
jgi:hypothetical protein